MTMMPPGRWLQQTDKEPHPLTQTLVVNPSPRIPSSTMKQRKALGAFALLVSHLSFQSFSDILKIHPRCSLPRHHPQPERACARACDGIHGFAAFESLQMNTLGSADEAAPSLAEFNYRLDPKPGRRPVAT